jgi:hypothetical protein
MSSSGPFSEKVSLRLHQETADLDESCKLLRARWIEKEGLIMFLNVSSSS